jgi:hypothetical protein
MRTHDDGRVGERIPEYYLLLASGSSTRSSNAAKQCFDIFTIVDDRPGRRLPWLALMITFVDEEFINEIHFTALKKQYFTAAR